MQPFRTKRINNLNILRFINPIFGFVKLSVGRTKFQRLFFELERFILWQMLRPSPKHNCCSLARPLNCFAWKPGLPKTAGFHLFTLYVVGSCEEGYRLITFGLNALQRYKYNFFTERRRTSADVILPPGRKIEREPSDKNKWWKLIEKYWHSSACFIIDVIYDYIWYGGIVS